jgi:hypothetical protein
MEESRRTYTVVVAGHSDNIRVSACTKFHAVQLAYAKASHIQPDLSKYKVKPRLIRRVG